MTQQIARTAATFAGVNSQSDADRAAWWLRQPKETFLFQCGWYLSAVHRSNEPDPRSIAAYVVGEWRHVTIWQPAGASSIGFKRAAWHHVLSHRQ